MSAPPIRRERPSEVVAGLMASAAIFVSLIAIVYRPVRVAPFAMVVALVAAGIGGRHSKLAAFAVGVSTAAWVVGMVIAVLAKHPLY